MMMQQITVHYSMNTTFLEATTLTIKVCCKIAYNFSGILIVAAIAAIVVAALDIDEIVASQHRNNHRNYFVNRRKQK